MSARVAVRSSCLAFLVLAGLAPTTGTEAAGSIENARPVSVRLDPALRAPRAEALPPGAEPAVRAAFPVFLDGESLSLRVQGFPVLPGEDVFLEAPGSAMPLLRHQAGLAAAVGEATWRWTAPEQPGIYGLELSSGADTVAVTALVLHPASAVRRGRLNGYALGTYPTEPLRGDPAYVAPIGFVEVADQDDDILVTPHFTLGQFKCKQPGEPGYLALSRPLLVKLEAIAGVLARRGFAPTSLQVMSGFRTPAYNATIGNETEYSRHLWGDAADVFVDATGDGQMDDLNGDGRSDMSDAKTLAGWIEQLSTIADVPPGGLAAYDRNAAHGPFVHVDARGTPARW